MNQCMKCKNEIEDHETYEYRGALSCESCFDEVIESRDRERLEIIREEHKKTDTLKGLDLSDSVIGKANRDLLKGKIEVSSKESAKLKYYERGVK
jgi:recombinational DNA repair protein (RecF pathway)